VQSLPFAPSTEQEFHRLLQLMEHLVLVQEIQVVAQQNEKQWASKESAKSKETTKMSL
jgi:hypothetical protein